MASSFSAMPRLEKSFRLTGVPQSPDDSSPLDADIIWAGTDDGLIHITKDGGKSWQNVTPPTLRSWDKISQIDASHFDKNTAYISVNAFRLDDLTPYIYKTKDSGKTWTLITKGMSKHRET